MGGSFHGDLHYSKRTYPKIKQENRFPLKKSNGKEVKVPCSLKFS